MFHAITKPPARLSVRKQRIFDFLSSFQSGVLSSVTSEGEPHASVIYYFVDPELFQIFFLTKNGTQKYDNLVHNNQVVFVVYDAETQKVAHVYGQAYEIIDARSVNEVASRIYRQKLQTGKAAVLPISRLQAGAYTAFTIVPSQIHLASFSQPKSGDYEHMFESIESFDLHPTLEN